MAIIIVLLVGGLLTPIANQTTGQTLGPKPITLDTTGKAGIVKATSNTINILASRNDVAVVEAYANASIAFSSVTDSQSNTYTQRVTVDGSPVTLHHDLWTSSLVKSSGTMTITVTLSSIASFEIMVSLYAGVLSLGNSASSVLNGCNGCSHGSNFVTLNTQNNNNWVVGGNALFTSATCMSPEPPTACGAAGCPPPCLTPTQRQVDLSPSFFTGDFEDAISPTPTNGVSFTVGFAAPFPTTSKEIVEAVELVCCQTQPASNNVTATPGLVPVAQLIPFVFAGLVLVSLAYDFVQKRTPGGL
ncbi:MAG TPA: hypothetical protein VF910_07275 [Candidatus Bathyarchaeia archaeon]